MWNKWLLVKCTELGMPSVSVKRFPVGHWAMIMCANLKIPLLDLICSFQSLFDNLAKGKNKCFPIIWLSWSSFSQMSTHGRGLKPTINIRLVIIPPRMNGWWGLPLPKHTCAHRLCWECKDLQKKKVQIVYSQLNSFLFVCGVMRLMPYTSSDHLLSCYACGREDPSKHLQGFGQWHWILWPFALKERVRAEDNWL